MYVALAGLLTRSDYCAFPTVRSVAVCGNQLIWNSQQRVLSRIRTVFPIERLHRVKLDGYVSLDSGVTNVVAKL